MRRLKEKKREEAIITDPFGSYTGLVKDPDLLLISDIFPKEEIEKIETDKLMILSGGMSDLSREDVIYKYQAGEQILSEIIEQCEEIYTNNELFFMAPNKKKGKIIFMLSSVTHNIPPKYLL